MSKQTVFLVGATGETGESILQALLDDGSFVSFQIFIHTWLQGTIHVQRISSSPPRREMELTDFVPGRYLLYPPSFGPETRCSTTQGQGIESRDWRTIRLARKASRIAGRYRHRHSLDLCLRCRR